MGRQWRRSDHGDRSGVGPSSFQASSERGSVRPETMSDVSFDSHFISSYTLGS